MRPCRLVLPLAALVALAVAGCADESPQADGSPRAGDTPPASAPPASAPPASAPPASAEPTSTPPASAPSDERLSAVLDGVELSLEVADTPEERAVGLMRRTSVPPGTGMVFLYDEPSTGRFYMYDVPIPLRAVFVAEGRVVSTVVMPPCEEPEPGDCPTYGADAPFDTVVETAPETLPDVQPGDVLELER